MSYLTEYCDVIRRWIDEEEDAYSNAEVTEWIRDGEERINNELRVKEMMKRDYATFDDDCAVLPDDWLEHVYVRIKGGKPFDYITPHDFWVKRYDNVSPLAPQPDPYGGEVYPAVGKTPLYTVIGSTLFVYPPINPDKIVNVEIAYFAKVTPLGDTKSLIFDRYPAIYRNCVLTCSAPYLVEGERINEWGALATAAIQKANDAYKAGRWSGSPLPKLIRSFG